MVQRGGEERRPTRRAAWTVPSHLRRARVFLLGLFLSSSVLKHFCITKVIFLNSAKKASIFEENSDFFFTTRKRGTSGNHQVIETVLPMANKSM